MNRQLSLPSPTAIIAFIALFVALGGSGYAASQLAHTAKHKNRHGKSQKALIKAAVAKYLAGHRAQFIGATGPAGGIGPQGGIGPPGPRGETGPTGLASASDRLAGPVSTGSATPVDLGGPSVTVNVGPSGLVAFWAKAKLKSVGGGTAEIVIQHPTGYATQITNSSSSPIQMFTKAESNTGTFIFNPGLSTMYVGPGTKTFSLTYSDSAGTGVFEDLELVVIPL
jgi:hypothetical protein